MEEKYIPKKSSLEFIAFIRACAVEDNSNSEIHYRLADKYFGKDKQVLIESFRGSAKSTLMEWYILYIAVKGTLPGFGRVSFIAFIGDSMENGVKNMFRNLAGKIDKSPLLQKFLTISRKTDSEMELKNITGVELNLKGYGASTNIRGVRYRGHRPDIIILDDITTYEAKNSEAIQNTINDNFYKSVIPALHPTRYKIFFIGTPISEKDIIHQLSTNPEWVVHKFPICEKFPCSKEDFKGAWEDRFPYEAVRSKYEMYNNAGKAQDFYQEYMLEITDLSTLLVDEDDINWFDPAVIIKNRSGYNYYISTDFATSTKKSADYSTIGVWAISSNNDWILIDGQCKRQTMHENIEDLFRYVSKWKPLSVGIETSGQQGGFISIIDEMKLQRNVWFQFAKKPGSKEVGIRPTKDKVQRFITGVQPKFKQGKVWLPKPELVKSSNFRLFELVEEMVNELSRFTMAGGVAALKHDDCGTFDTIVDTPTGPKMLGTIKDGDEVIGFGPRGSVVCKAKDVRITGIKPIVNIETESGTILRFSEFHPILTESGYKLFRDLQVGDKLIRNKQWKTQLNMQELNGQRNQMATTSLLQDVMMGQEKIGYTNTLMKRVSEKLPKGVKFITKMKTKMITAFPILSYSLMKNTELNTQSRIRLMAISLLSMWRRTLKRSWNLLGLQRGEHILERIKEEKYQINQSDVLTVEGSLLQMRELEKILSAVVASAEMSGIISTQEKKCVKNVEQYLNLVLGEHATVVMSAETSSNLKRLEEITSMYALCAKHLSKGHYNKLAAEINAQEIEKMNLNDSTEKIKNVWISSPEATYNFEVDVYHNYQVHDGFIAHNCLDLLNQLSEMEIYVPSEEVAPERSKITEDGLIWTGSWDDEELDEYSGSTVF